MRMLFTKSDAILSKLIRASTKEDVSHVALEFPSLGIIVHSNLLGVHIDWAANFKKHCEVVYILERTDTPDDIVKLSKLLADYEWAFYDVGALFFLGLSLTLRNYLKIPLPKANLWQSSSMFLCTEWADAYLDLPNNAMMTAKGLYNVLKCQPSWK